MTAGLAKRLGGYAALWASFGLLHSTLANERARERMGRLVGAGERLTYCGIAVVHLGVVLRLGEVLLGGYRAFPLPSLLRWTLRAMTGVGVAVLLATARSYELGRFIGITQLRDRWGEATPREPRSEELVTTGLHRFVRHPLYLGTVLLLWGRATTPLRLATAALATGYIVLGIRTEERKLLAAYGPAYAAYRAKVPALLPGLRAYRGQGA